MTPDPRWLKEADARSRAEVDREDDERVLDAIAMHEAGKSVAAIARKHPCRTERGWYQKLWAISRAMRAR